MSKRKFLPITVFFGFLAGFLATLFIFQIFFTGQNFNTNPIYGSVQSSIQRQKQNVIVLMFNVSSSYFNTVFSSDSGKVTEPSVIKDDSAYKMWMSDIGPSGSNYFYGIYYATSTDSFSWSAKQLVLQPTSNMGDELYAYEPSVVKVNSTYYMYYAGASASTVNNATNVTGSIFLATSTDGKTWTKYKSNSNLQPVISPTIGEGLFNSVTRPSVLFYNSKFYLYYTNSTSGAGRDIFLATSDDGKQFTLQNNARPVFVPPVGNDNDVKYLNSLKTFFMVYGSSDTNKIFWTNSSDGIGWQAHDDSRTIKIKKQCNYGPALLGYANGTSDLQTVVYYGAGELSNSSTYCSAATSWTIDASLINISLTNYNLITEFNASDFKCSSITNGFSCKINYINSLNESALVLFLLVNSKGDVVSNSVPIAAKGASHAGMLVFCNKFSGDFKVSWRVYRQSDVGLGNPVAWSSSKERQSLTCQI